MTAQAIKEIIMDQSGSCTDLQVCRFISTPLLLLAFYISFFVLGYSVVILFTRPDQSYIAHSTYVSVGQLGISSPEPNFQQPACEAWNNIMWLWIY